MSDNILGSFMGTGGAITSSPSNDSIQGPGPAQEEPSKRPKKVRAEGEKRTVSVSRLERLIEAKKITTTQFLSEVISFVEGKEAEGTLFSGLGEALTAYAEANSRKGGKVKSAATSNVDKLQRNMVQFMFDSKIVNFGELVDLKKSRKAENLYNAEFKQKNDTTDKIWVNFEDAEYVSWGIHNTTLNSISKDELRGKMEAEA